jgi:hypothetical protein
MLGVAVSEDELEWVREFFELFKTAWEPAIPGRRYDALLRTHDSGPAFAAGVHIVYGSVPTPDLHDSRTIRRSVQVATCFDGRTMPVYAGVAVFGPANDETLIRLDGHAVDSRQNDPAGLVWRIGYDLFAEVRLLLTEGQPVDHAETPTLEVHIDLLREILVRSGVPFVEIPPRPLGYDFACCLTHDVDFFGLRRHQLDRTFFGFLTRALFGTVADLVRRRRSFQEALTNWRAAATAPLVLLGMARDPWHPFEGYADAEDPRHSTFFLMPFKGRPGRALDGVAPRHRAVAYQISDIAGEIREAVARGSEVAVHGLDAWCDVGAGRSELAELRAIDDRGSVGVRMHWLYFSDDAPERLESAGFSYDSTVGYNDTVGFRAGTSQVYQPRGSKKLLELPLAIMDTALYFTGRMGLAWSAGIARCRKVIADVRKYGGTVVTNWHDRSLAPERLWARAYRELLLELASDGRVWFATGSRAVEWFRWRRSIVLATSEGELRIQAPYQMEPGATIRLHRAQSGRRFVDVPFNGQEPVCLNS